MPYIIEFIGVPGSGKTYSSIRLASHLCAEVPKVMSYADFSNRGKRLFCIARKAISAVKCMVRFPREFISLSHLILSNEYMSNFIGWSILINYFHLIVFLRKSKLENCPSIIEQGVFQIGWPLIYYSKGKELSLFIFRKLIANAIKNIGPSRYVIVCIRPSEVVLVDRMKKRGLSDLSVSKSMASFDLLCSNIMHLECVSEMIFISSDGSDFSIDKTNSIILDLVKGNG